MKLALFLNLFLYIFFADARAQVKGFPVYVGVEYLFNCVGWESATTELEMEFVTHFKVKHTKNSFDEILDKILLSDVVAGLSGEANAKECDCIDLHSKKKKDLKIEKELLSEIHKIWEKAQYCTSFSTRSLEKLNAVRKLYDK